jgi:hypothetical protein
VGNQ